MKLAVQPRLRSLLPLLGFAVFPASLAAQEEVPAAYERLATTFAHGELLVGETPAGFPTEIIPGDAEVLGSVEMRGRSIVLLTVPRDARVVEREVREDLLQSGWVYGAVARPSGFVDAERPLLPSSAMARVPPQFCRGERGIHVMANAVGGSAEVQLSWEPRSDSQCVFGGPVRAMVPTLRGPAGMEIRGGGTSSGDTFARAEAAALSELSASELVQHFVPQLREAGWSVEMGEDSPAFASRIARKQDDQGSEWLGFLRVTRIPETDMIELGFLVTQPEELHPGR